MYFPKKIIPVNLQQQKATYIVAIASSGHRYDCPEQTEYHISDS